MQRLHEAEVLAEYGEIAELYARSQFLTKAFEAIGLPTLSVWERAVDENGRVIDFDGRPMYQKTLAALGVRVAPFDFERRLVEHENQVEVLDKLQPGEAIAEDSWHPNVDDELAAIHGYHPEFRYLMKRLYIRTENSLLLYNYAIPQGMGGEGITHHGVDGSTTIEDLLRGYDTEAEAKTGLPYFLGELWDGRERDYSNIERQRRELEDEASPYLDVIVELAREIGLELKKGTITAEAGLAEFEQYERGFMTLMLVKFNPDRADSLITDEDLAWAQQLLQFDARDIILAAADIANRNQLDFIACGSLLAAILGGGNLLGGDMKCVTCPGCKKVVDAISTPTKIQCPSCKLEVAK